MRTDDPLARSAIHQEAVAFLRSWLPPEARRVYREMIMADPRGWSRHPHFAGGVIAEHALRGNGLDERALGVRDLNELWPELLRRAVEEPEEPA